MLKVSSNTLIDITDQQFENYILYDKKLSANKPALYALKSRFRTLKKHFDVIPLNRQTFSQFLAEEKGRGISDTTLNKYISCAKHIAHLRNQHDLDDLTYFHETKKELTTLTWDEMRSLAQVILPYRLSKEGISCEEQNLRMWCYITLLSEVGCRKSEALNLTWDNVKPYFVTFPRTKNYEKRSVPITPLLYSQLRRLSRINERVFVVSDLSAQMLLDLKKRAKVLGITKPIYNHIIRHSVATYLLSSKAPLKLVCNILGWKDPKTADRYDQSGIAEMEEVLNEYSRIFREHLSFEMKSQKAIAYLKKLFDLESLQISQTCDRLEVQVKKCNS